MKGLAVWSLALLLGLPLFSAPEYPKMGPDVYDPKAAASEQIAAAVRQAATGKKHVLLVFGANWCIWCRRLHETFASDPKVARALRDHYEIVLVDVNTRNGTKRNAEVNERYGNPIEKACP